MHVEKTQGSSEQKNERRQSKLAKFKDKIEKRFKVQLELSSKLCEKTKNASITLGYSLSQYCKLAISFLNHHVELTSNGYQLQYVKKDNPDEKVDIIFPI